MIYGFVQVIKEDISLLSHWIRGQEIPNAGNDAVLRIQTAALRVLASLGMLWGALWGISILVFVATIPLQAILKLATAVGLYALGHDIFVMIQNASQRHLMQELRAGWAFMHGFHALEEERARQFTNGTFLQPMWMWLYVNRNIVNVVPQ